LVLDKRLTPFIPSPGGERGFCVAKFIKVENWHTVLPFRRRDLRDEVRK